MIWQSQFNIVSLKCRTLKPFIMYATINSLEDLKIAINHPYRNGEFLCDGTQVFEVSDDDDEMVALIDSYESGELSYSVNWESQDLFTEDGIQIESVY